MSSDLIVKENDALIDPDAELKEFVTILVEDQMFGIPVLLVEDVLRSQEIANIPLSPPAILGSINLRGKIVTAIDVRTRLNLPPFEGDGKPMHVVVDHKGEQYSLVVDKVGEVLNLSPADFEKNPPNLSENWQSVSSGVYRLKDKILLILNIESLLEI